MGSICSKISPSATLPPAQPLTNLPPQPATAPLPSGGTHGPAAIPDGLTARSAPRSRNVSPQSRRAGPAKSPERAGLAPTTASTPALASSSGTPAAAGLDNLPPSSVAPALLITRHVSVESLRGGPAGPSSVSQSVEARVRTYTSEADLIKDPTRLNALYQREDGEWRHEPLTANEALVYLTEFFNDPKREGLDATPGRLSAMLEKLGPEVVLVPELLCALQLIKFHQDTVSSRREIEDALLAAMACRLNWNADPIVVKNAKANIIPRPTNLAHMDAMAKGEALFLVNSGFASTSGPVLNWGAGANFLTAHLAALGVEAYALEPNLAYYVELRAQQLSDGGEWFEPEELKRFDAVVEKTADEARKNWPEAWPEEKFASVIASNFDVPPDGRTFEEVVQQEIENMADFVRPDANIAIGIAHNHLRTAHLIEDKKIHPPEFQEAKFEPCGDSRHFVSFHDTSGQVGFINYVRRSPRDAASVVPLAAR